MLRLDELPGHCVQLTMTYNECDLYSGVGHTYTDDAASFPSMYTSRLRFINLNGACSHKDKIAIVDQVYCGLNKSDNANDTKHDR